jgi:NMD protein affecting ribosome stability and mRNA decay
MITITHFCDRCGKPIYKGEARYVVNMKVYAAADQPFEISSEDLFINHLAEIERLIEEASSMTEEELMQDVYVEYKFDLCRRCQRKLLYHPLPPMSVIEE